MTTSINQISQLLLTKQIITWTQIKKIHKIKAKTKEKTWKNKNPTTGKAPITIRTKINPSKIWKNNTNPDKNS